MSLTCFLGRIISSLISHFLLNFPPFPFQPAYRMNGLNESFFLNLSHAHNAAAAAAAALVSQYTQALWGHLSPNCRYGVHSNPRRTLVDPAYWALLAQCSRSSCFTEDPINLIQEQIAPKVKKKEKKKKSFSGLFAVLCSVCCGPRRCRASPCRFFDILILEELCNVHTAIQIVPFCSCQPPGFFYFSN